MTWCTCKTALLVSLTAVVTFAADNQPMRLYPPRITKNPKQQEAYQANQDITVELPCKASGQPPPTYTWLKDGIPLEIEGSDMSMEPGEGTLLIHAPKADHEGVYQCKAENGMGIALSVKSSLKQAVMKPFDRIGEQTYEVKVGEHLKLECRPPLSFPRGNLFWGNQNFQGIKTDARITQDYEGNLWFANVEMKDHNEGDPYICHVGNTVIHSLMQGDGHKIDPIPVGDKPKYIAPNLVWHSQSPSVAIAGTTKKLKCIFTGYPTPSVTWEKAGGPLSKRAYTDDTGLELIIPRVDYEDAGTYRCRANNMEGRPDVTKNLILSVESGPKWVIEPENFQSAEEEAAEFFCEAMGVPPPTIQWTINGVPVEELPPDSRRVVTKNSVTYRNLTKTDAQVLQCNASNIHGYIFSNAYLSVFAEPPSFIVPPEEETVIGMGQSANLSCVTFGSPTPKVTWKLGEEVIGIQGKDPIKPRFQVSKDGNLTVIDAQVNDTGSYECQATNKFDTISAIGKLSVREPTQITKGPESQSVNASSTVTLECEVTTDPNEMEHLTVEWKYNGQYIDYDKNPRITKNPIDNSLTIEDVEVDDTGEYVCVADNGIDVVEVPGTITVKDKPCPPDDWTIQADCSEDTAEVLWAWRQEFECNDEVIEFIIYYNTSFDEPGVFHEAVRVPKAYQTADVPLSPWANYTFHVRARNSMGLSDRSEFSGSKCTTPPAPPETNPIGVCVELKEETQLIIVWMAMNQIEHNGEGFHYRVSYTEVPAGSEQVVDVTDWRQERLEISDVPTFQKYEIYVQAVNDLGPSPDRALAKIFGHSGEGEPSVFPENFVVDPDSINSTSAMFAWDPVDESSEKIQGFFRGYKIKYWRAVEPENVRSHETIKHESIDICPPVDPNRPNPRKPREADGESAFVEPLWPFSTITAGILALNNGREGKMSPTIEFKTPEGVPGPLGMFVVKLRGSYHFGVAWEPPPEPNGIITGYILGYAKVSDPLGTLTTTSSVEASQRSMCLCGLDPEETYMLYMWAATSAGEGERLVIQDTTKPEGETGQCEDTAHCTGHTEPLIVKEKTAFVWWIFLLCLILFILIIILVLCLIMRGRRGVYEVFKNEKSHGRDPDKDIKDEGFDEVGDPEKAEEPLLPQRLEDDDTGSLEDYGEPDTGFDEDGSFIGQYGYPTKPAPAPVTT